MNPPEKKPKFRRKKSKDFVLDIGSEDESQEKYLDSMTSKQLAVVTPSIIVVESKPNVYLESEKAIISKNKKALNLDDHGIPEKI